MAFILPILVFACAAVALPLARKIAIRSGFVDTPGGRKQHHAPVPPIGGVVIVPLFLIALLLLSDFSQPSIALSLSAVLLLIIGGWDDYKSVMPKYKLGAQILAAAGLIWIGDIWIYHLGDLPEFGIFYLGFMAAPFTIAALVLLMNAVNLSDGLDGLAAGQSLIMALWLCIGAWLGNDFDDLPLIACFAASLLAFLIYNARNPWRRKASIFLGDAGSLTLALILGYFLITLTQYGAQPLPPLSAAWIVAVPVIDAIAQFIRRLRSGLHPFDPDRYHLHHHFTDNGVSVTKTVLIIWGLNILSGGIGIFLPLTGISDFVNAGLWALVLLFYIWFASKPERLAGFISQYAKARK